MMKKGNKELANRNEVLLQREQLQMYRGPIPDPQTLAEYNAINDGFADRIISMAENQLEHRTTIEKRIVEAKIRQEKFGMICGFVLALLVILGGIFLIYSNKDASGLGMIIGSLATLVGAFLYTEQKNRKEIQDKKEELD